MSVQVPRTVKAVTSDELLALDDEARSRRYNRHHGSGWLAEYAALSAAHYLHPVLVHRLTRRPEYSPHWRCALLLQMRDVQQVFSLLDVWPPTFDRIPESLSRAEKTTIATLLLDGTLITAAQWADSTP
ncbi:hypothetical protein [Pilimelia columellifera]|uniref:Uncharacterized protein n=1 Tax=Pilimelia columellifera subsp. columellifera TaxID=706583 RepID=A0ABP6ATA8_9ACTN